MSNFVLNKKFEGENKEWLGFVVDVNGNRAIAGMPRADNSSGVQTGAIYFYKYDGASESWMIDISFQGDGAGDQFGDSVGINGNRAIVGAAYNDNVSGSDAGAVYFYKYDSGSWSFDSSFQGDDATNYLGTSVAITENSAVAGGSFNFGAGGDRGGVIFYNYDSGGSGWDVDVSFEGENASDRMGNAVSINGNKAVVGAWEYGGSNNGAVYSYSRTGSSWTFDVSFSGSVVGELFGTGVSIRPPVAWQGLFV